VLQVLESSRFISYWWNTLGVLKKGGYMDRAFYFPFALLLATFVFGCNREAPPSNATPVDEGRKDSTSAPLAAADITDDASKSNTATQVPQLTGVPNEWAIQLLRLKQLQGVQGRLYLPDDRWQSDWAEGRVYVQTPQPATWAKPDAHVAFWTVHRAAEDDALAEVPDVIGKSLEEAKAAIEEAGLGVMTVSRKPTPNEASGADAVLDQFPRAQQVLGPSSTVLLHVATDTVSN
jgi:beta-lactam-binding protein with PASTA domain